MSKEESQYPVSTQDVIPFTDAPGHDTSSATPQNNPEACNRNSLWENLRIHRKSYAILAAQLGVTAMISSVFTFVNPIPIYSIQKKPVHWISVGVDAFLLMKLFVGAIWEKARRGPPMNFFLRFIITLALSYITGTISSNYETRAVLLAVVITVILTLAITIFSLQTKVDFTSRTGDFDTINMALLVTNMITGITFCSLFVYWLHIAHCVISVIRTSLFLVLNTQLLLVNGPQPLYTGIVKLYLSTVQITGS